MVASMVQYQAVLGKVKDGCGKVQPTADWVVKVLEAEFCSETLSTVLPFVHLPDLNPLCAVVKRNIHELQGYLDKYLPEVEATLTFLEAVPIFMWNAGNEWKNIQSATAQLGNSTGWLSQNEYMGWWEGYAGQAYSTGVGDQSGAVNSISATAGSISSACDSFFAAALTFLVSIANDISNLLEELLTAVPTLGSTAVLAAGSAVVSFTGAIGVMKEAIDQIERQLQGLLPIPDMYGGSSITADDWPSATQGSF
jgi:hypothetical protein